MPEITLWSSTVWDDKTLSLKLLFAVLTTDFAFWLQLECGRRNRSCFCPAVRRHWKTTKLFLDSWNTQKYNTHSQKLSISSIRNNRWKLHHFREPQIGMASKIQSDLFNNTITAQNVPSLEAHLIFPVITKSFLMPLLFKSSRPLSGKERCSLCRLIDRSLRSAPQLRLTLSQTESHKIL